MIIKAEFARGEDEILKGISFSVSQGSPLAIVGESGSGKTMCAFALLGLLPSNCTASGSAILDGVELIGLKERKLNAMRGRDMTYIPQSGAEFLNPALKIKTQVFETLRKAGFSDKSKMKSLAVEKLAEAGLTEDAADVLEKYPHQLSGGQAQRTVLAISLCQNAKLVIADEPTKGIDEETAEAFEECMYGAFSKACLIVITHDIKLASKCKNVAVLKDGQILEYGSVNSVLRNPQTEYTKSLIAAVPTGDICWK